MTRIFIIAIGIGTLHSCSEQKEEVVDFDDIAPQSELYNDDNDVQNVGPVIDSLVDLKMKFSSNGVAFDEFKIADHVLFPDRFGPKKSEKYMLVNEEDTIFYNRWVYGDSIKTYSAFYNWIDCFSGKCKSFYVNQELNVQQNAFKIMLYDTAMIFIECSGELNFNLWDDFHDSLQYEKADCELIIEQRRRGRTKWFKFDEDKHKIPLEE